jgi:hypothetical protein
MALSELANMWRAIMPPFRNTLILLAAFACSVQAQTVVINSNLSVYQRHLSNEEFSVGVGQNAESSICCPSAPNTDYTEVYFDYDGTRVAFNNTLLDESMDVYIVKAGDVFSPANIQAGLFPKVFVVYPSTTSSVVVSSGDFYLGVSTGQGIANIPGTYIPNRTAFGWVHLHPISVNSVSMVDNVMSYNSPGIIVGTTTLVPEPATISTTICALFWCFAGRRERRK